MGSGMSCESFPPSTTNPPRLTTPRTTFRKHRPSSNETARLCFLHVASSHLLETLRASPTLYTCTWPHVSQSDGTRRQSQDKDENSLHGDIYLLLDKDYPHLLASRQRRKQSKSSSPHGAQVALTCHINSPP
ncbi:hypothetical protein LSTR_LSTR007833 [Laodelphax striatellus]|uniref:Uncharacterized protein n=1 Tax=Laodelphax striatellus TaxID=195883 RepID=A0A482WNM7_LAOST|nr:hypothetical protein LSTR_LSTR014796 [Laodelphax striatellus]RZF34781.1 hypothetical protein LSTR_LSTR007833 [Laodelphax striatellus]